MHAQRAERRALNGIAGEAMLMAGREERGTGRWGIPSEPRATGDGDGCTGGTSFTGGGAADLAAGLSGLPGQGAGGRDDDSAVADQPCGGPGAGGDGSGEQRRGRGRRPDELRLLALLRLRRLPVQLLRGRVDLVSA